MGSPTFNQRYIMKRNVLMTIALVVGIGSFLHAQEADRVPSAMTASASVGFPTTISIGAYHDFSILDDLLGADRPYLAGIEGNVYLGSALGAGQIFASTDPKGFAYNFV